VRFYGRRYVRILVPVLGTVLLFKIFFPGIEIVGDRSILWQSTLWSVLCEEIYYALYPALNRVAPQVGWVNVLIVASCLSVAVIAFGFPAIDWKDVGVIGTAVTLFPVWLLGCYLADNIASLKDEVSRRAIWLWRLGAWGAMWLQLMLHFHSPIHQTASGVVVGIFCYFWLRAEIGYHRDRAPWPLLVWAGRWSYSLYLMHPIVVGVLLASGYLSFESRIGWLIGMALVLLGSYLFYLAVERPSHHFARKIPMFAAEPLGKDPALARPS
jgi:peptidoglycan/LPS O-acetylase OafA/YrhL